MAIMKYTMKTDVAAISNYKMLSSNADGMGLTEPCSFLRQMDEEETNELNFETGSASEDFEERPEALLTIQSRMLGGFIMGASGSFVAHAFAIVLRIHVLSLGLLYLVGSLGGLLGGFIHGRRVHARAISARENPWCFRAIVSRLRLERLRKKIQAIDTQMRIETNAATRTQLIKARAFFSENFSSANQSSIRTVRTV